MRIALVGYTGFVGSNLRVQYPFDDLYNSKNIADIEGKEYKTVETPVTRTYPKSGKTPTKISPIKVNIHILSVLFKAVAGKYKNA